MAKAKSVPAPVQLIETEDCFFDFESDAVGSALFDRIKKLTMLENVDPIWALWRIKIAIKFFEKEHYGGSGSLDGLIPSDPQWENEIAPIDEALGLNWC